MLIPVGKQCKIRYLPERFPEATLKCKFRAFRARAPFRTDQGRLIILQRWCGSYDILQITFPPSSETSNAPSAATAMPTIRP